MPGVAGLEWALGLGLALAGGPGLFTLGLLAFAHRLGFGFIGRCRVAWDHGRRR